MKSITNFFVIKTLFIVFGFLNSIIVFSQNTALPPKIKSDFWKHVQFGGGVGLSIGSGYTDITLAPSAIYNFNDYVSAGIGLQGTYVSSKNYFNSAIYGASIITLFNPIEQIQLSIELEQARVNRTLIVNNGNSIKDDFWNTGLFLGAGYRSGNVIVGARYNVLYTKNDFVYSDALMPFVRIYF